MVVTFRDLEAYGSRLRIDSTFTFKYRTRSSANAETARVELNELTQISNHQAVHGHSRPTISVPVESTLCDFLLVNNINLHSISVRFSVIAEYWSNSYHRFETWCLFNALVLGAHSLLNLASQNYRYHSIVWCANYFDILNRLGVAHQCDRRTDGRTERPLATTRAKNGQLKVLTAVFAELQLLRMLRSLASAWRAVELSLLTVLSDAGCAEGQRIPLNATSTHFTQSLRRTHIMCE